jgi:hypothetical protein
VARASLTFDFLARDRGAGKTFKDIADKADRTEKKLRQASKAGSGFGSSLKSGLAVGAGAVAAAGLGKMFTGFISDARESAKIGRLTTAVITSTGGAANVTAKQVGSLATAISNKTGADDEAVQSGANLLLTFTKVRNETGKGNDIFNQATLAATDMAAALGTDTKGAALQLGKALNDPIKGVSALGKAGVSFTAQQKEQIKTLVQSGDVLGAQKIILGEMQTQFGGAAKAAADPLQRLQVVAGNLGERIGGALLPTIEKGADLFGQFADGLNFNIKVGGGAHSMATQLGLGVRALGLAFKDGDVTSNGFVGTMERVGVALRDAFTFVKVEVLPRLRDFGGFLKSDVIPALISTANFVKRNSDFFVPFVAILGGLIVAIKAWRTAQIALNFVLAMNPIGLVVVAIAALGAGLVMAYKRSETFRNVVDGAFKVISAGAQFMWNNVLKPTFRFLVETWLTVAGAILNGAATAFGWVPGLGGKLKDAAGKFDTFKADVNRSLAGLRDQEINVTAKASIIGTGPLARAAIMDSRTTKGRAAQFATGGWTGPGGKYEPAGVVHRDEYVVRKESRQNVERNFPGLLDYMNKRGTLPGYARGGLVRAEDGSYVPRSFYDTVSPEFARSRGIRMRASVPQPRVFVDPAERLADIAGRRIAAAAKAAVERATAGMVLAEDGTLVPRSFYDRTSYGGGAGMGYRRQMAVLRSRFPGLQLISGFRPGAITATGNRSYHGMGRAVDIPPLMQVFDWIRANYGRATKELIFSPAGGRQVNNGRSHMFSGITRANHWDHIHWAMDKGGLARGVGFMPKLTNRPERVLSPDQTESFERLVDHLPLRGRGGGVTIQVVNNGTMVGTSPDQLARLLSPLVLDDFRRQKRNGVPLGIA